MNIGVTGRRLVILEELDERQGPEPQRIETKEDLPALVRGDMIPVHGATHQTNGLMVVSRNENGQLQIIRGWTRENEVESYSLNLADACVLVRYNTLWFRESSAEHQVFLQTHPDYDENMKLWMKSSGGII